MWGGTPTRMRSNAVGGGDSYFMLGVGGCNYDASTGGPVGRGGIVHTVYDIV
jgi:hypothetical protein